MLHLWKKATGREGHYGGFPKRLQVGKTASAAEALRHASDLYDAGRLPEAEVSLRLILQAEPQNIGALRNLGRIHMKRGDSSAALEFLQRAVTVNPKFADAQLDLGNLLQSLNRNEESLEHYRNALAVEPNSSSALGSLGTALRALGRINEAEACFQRVIVLDPGNPDAYLSLVLTRKTQHDDPHVVALEQLRQKMGHLPPKEQIELHFTLGKMYADLGRNEESFRHLLEGNALKRRRTLYDEGNELRTFERIKQVFSGQLLKAKKGQGHTSELPIFVFGMPRSGTTLVEQILASHPSVFGAGELQDFGRIATGFRRSTGDPVTYPESVLSASPEALSRLGEEYAGTLALLSPSSVRITDKMPANYLFAGLIHLALPTARMIHVRRDPLDTCLSCFSILFGRSQSCTYNLGELGRYYHAYERLMEHWRAVLPEGAMLEIHYEDVVSDLDVQARRILAYCGLSWDSACLSFHKTQRAVRTASVYQVRQPIYRTSVGRWRPSEEILGPLLAGLKGEHAADNNDWTRIKERNLQRMDS